MLSNKDILQKIGNDIVLKLRDNMQSYNRNATGETSKSITATATEDKLVVAGRDHILTLEYGRQPTPGQNVLPSLEFIEKIKRWLKARSLSFSAYAVARNIHKKGFKGTPGVFSDIINDELVREIEEQIGSGYRTEIIKIIKV